MIIEYLKYIVRHYKWAYENGNIIKLLSYNEFKMMREGADV